MPNEAIATVRRNALRALIPPPRLKLSEWIETHMRLPDSVSALPGPIRLAPYMREIADAISDPEIERISLVKPVRVGFTTLLTGALASYIANEPSPILCLLPTESDCRDYVVSDIEPIFEATPVLRGLLSAEADETGRNTLLSRRFPGGSLKIVAAKSPRNLRRHNVRILLIDEADAMEAGAEGSPVTLAEKRTLSFANRKIILGSTPTFEATSNVLRAYAQSDQRVFEVSCPECGHFHEITWADIQWPEGEPERAHYVCPSCGCCIDERHKAAMVENGRWRATAPHVKGHAGFRLNALVSTLHNARWGALAAEFIEAKKSPDQLQVFVNTILAQGWREATESLDDTALAARAEDFSLESIPPEVLFVTAGVDVQRDRLEVVFLGWSRDEIFVLGQSAIYGDPMADDVWAELDEAIRTNWKHPKGGFLKVDATAVDSSDGVTMDRVVNFCRPRLGRRIFAIKGMAGNRPAIKRSNQKGHILFIVGVDGLKQQLNDRLTRGHSVRFSKTLEGRFYEELASERLVIRYQRGAPVRLWERVPGRRAESLDCVVYATAVRHLIGQKIEAREAEVANPGMTTKPVSPVVYSSWLYPNGRPAKQPGVW
ncbi:terminase GpA [Rhodomicrobium vannielii ATCC 17100]|uniref:Terminase GpA n=1 Tax=Rhodomicrobium vannielii (strain ATCC 17100 / DSM 162 / LMG 4299 / NCIMB 10020 / ATH 3.1.1) TaxID=648757 RepID=E3I864_RHOVT|nr:phage terminase large subunit family protein [Rhodomicrobium vannielii]ADP71990.1 terminase GpA [Rhodomicrobium vannielii ATCC 17100]